MSILLNGLKLIVFALSLLLASESYALKNKIVYVCPAKDVDSEEACFETRVFFSEAAVPASVKAACLLQNPPVNPEESPIPVVKPPPPASNTSGVNQ